MDFLEENQWDRVILNKCFWEDFHERAGILISSDPSQQLGVARCQSIPIRYIVRSFGYETERPVLIVVDMCVLFVLDLYFFTFIHMWWYSLIFVDICLDFLIFVYIYSYVVIFVYIRWYLSIFIHMWWSLSIFVDMCSHLFICGDICW